VVTFKPNPIYELDPYSSTIDLRDLAKLLPVVIDYLKTHENFDLAMAQVEFEQHKKQYGEEKAENERKKEIEAKTLETNAETRSYELLFSNFAPYVNNARVNWNFRFKIPEVRKGDVIVEPAFETETLESVMKEKRDVVVSHLALTDPTRYLAELEKHTDGTEFIVPLHGVYYITPTFKIKRLKW
jgi:hypothetical protein